MKRKALIKIAKDEIDRWDLNPAVVLAILFCFVHRITTGETFEETFLGGEPAPDWEI